MASTYQAPNSFPHAKEQYPHYTGFYGYITPYNDGQNVKLLRTGGTLHVGSAKPSSTMCDKCDCHAGPFIIQNWQQPAGYMRWCPSDGNC